MIEMANRSVITGLIIIIFCTFYTLSQECSSSLSYIRSPGYPGKYPKNLDCSWTIDTYDSNTVVAFNVDQLNLEPCSYCSCDYLTIFDDSSSAVTSKRFGKWCSGSHRLLSTGRYMHIQFHTDDGDGGTGFTSSHTKVSINQVCPKTSDTIKANYRTYGNVNCAWLLDAYNGNVIVLEVSYLDIGPCSDCSCGYLEVFNGSSSSAKKLGKWCSPPPFQISSGRYMYVRFVAKPDATSHSFTAKYKRIRQNSVCTSSPSLKASTGTIKSSDYSSDYLKSVDCSWLISADPDYVIRLTVDTLDLAGCFKCGFLKIYDGRTTASPILGKWISGKPDLISSGNDMLITFKTSLVSTATGLKATYRVIPKSQICPEVTDSQGTLTNYGYPNSYPGNIRCSWIISAPADHVIRFHTAVLDLPICSGKCDYMKIYDGATASSNFQLGRFDFAEKDVDLVSSGNRLLIEFKTYTGGSVGFKGYYSSIKKSEVCPGSGRIQASSTEKTISSREYPKHYWGNVKCSWHIEALAEHVIRFTVKTIDFQDCLSCSCDYIEIFDGSSSTTGVSYHKWCTLIPDLLSSGRHMFIEMRTSPLVSGKGFKAAYSSIHKSQVCPGSGLRFGESGTLQSPGYPSSYRGGLTCFWTIEAPFGKRVRFTSTNLNLQDCPSCGCDYLEIFDGTSHNSSSLGKWCTKAFDVVSTARYLYIAFKSNADVKGGEFQASYTIVAENEVCPVSKKTQTTGTLKSFGYPQNYPGNVKCTWNINAPVNNVIRLTFEGFEVSQCQIYTPCKDCGDYVEAYEVQGPSTVVSFQPWCGNSLPKEIFTSGPNLILKMRTDSNLHNKGFQAKYIFVEKNLGCKGTGLLTNKTGQLKAPEYPLQHQVDSLCIWKIQAPSGHTVQLSFDYVDETSCSSFTCPCSFIEVFDGSSSAKSSFGRICSNPYTSQYTSSGPFMYVTFWIDSSKGTGEKLAFSAKYKMIKTDSGSMVEIQRLWILIFFVLSTWINVL